MTAGPIKHRLEADATTQHVRLLLLFFFRLRRFRRLIRHECLQPSEFVFEAGNEIVRPVFEKDDKAEGEKQKQGDPKKGSE